MPQKKYQEFPDVVDKTSMLVLLGDPVTGALFKIDQSEIGGGTSARFGIEDNTGSENREMSMGSFTQKITAGTADFSGLMNQFSINETEIKLYSQAVDPTHNATVKTSYGEVHIAVTDGTAANTQTVSFYPQDFIVSRPAGYFMFGDAGITYETYDPFNPMFFQVSPNFFTIAVNPNSYFFMDGNTMTWGEAMIPEYADNGAAHDVGGLTFGTVYRTGDVLKIVHTE